MALLWQTARIGLAAGSKPPNEDTATIDALLPVLRLATALACALVVLSSLWRWSESGAASLVVGGALYIAGVFLVTVFANVPMNNTLDAIHPTTAEAAAFWTRYLANWTAWNHVRTVSSLASAALITIGVYLSARGIGG